MIKRARSVAGRLGLSICAALVISLPARAQTGCGRIHLTDMDPVDWRGGGSSYDCFDAAQYVQAVEIRVRKTGGGSCRYAIGISEGGAGVFDPRELSRPRGKLLYNVHDSASLASILMDMTFGGAVITGEFTDVDAKQEAHRHTYYWSIPAGQVVHGSNSRYQDRLGFHLHEEVGDVYVPRQSATKHHRARASKMVEVSLVDTGAPFNAADVSQELDFGTFSSGESLSFDLRARGNTSFDVSLQSHNQGTMAHASLRSSVPYTLEVDGVPADLTSGSSIPIASSTSGMTGPEGDVYEIEVTIGSLSGSLGGLHRDSITVTLTAE